MRRALAACVHLVLLSLGSAPPADALGNLLCGSAEVADTFDIGNGPVNGNGVFLVVAGTSELLGGAALDPRVEVHRLSDGALLACNDDHGSDYGGCSLPSTTLMENFTVSQGSNVLYRIGPFDSAVFFVNPPGGVRVTIRGSPQPASGMGACGFYTLHLFGY